MTRYDRYGEPREDEQVEEPPRHSRCVGGWLGEDREGRPIPCLECRPHLRKVVPS